MPEPMTVPLNAEMQEIVELAIQEGLGDSPETIVRLALNAWWGTQLLSGYSSEELRRIGEEIVADTRPGIPAEEAFAKLKNRYRKMVEATQASNAA